MEEASLLIASPPILDIEIDARITPAGIAPKGRGVNTNLTRIEKPQIHLLPYGTDAQQVTQAYALAASFLRTITIPAIPRLSNNQEDGSR